METNFFVKSHALGNTYIVLDEDNTDFKLNSNTVKRLCNINYGIGSDGVLLKVKSCKADFGLRIFNPDGSEAEKSGNGLRIFCKYIFDHSYINSTEFSVETMGGIVNVKIVSIFDHTAKTISVDMGKANFKSKEIPTDFPAEEALGVKLIADGREYEVNCVSVGNPHCVIIKDDLDIEEIKKYGISIENHKNFPNRINVQFAKVISRSEAEILIWERGAGFTLSSGSSSCAVACVLKKRGLTDNKVRIRMPGGEMEIEVDNDWNIRMTGEARQIAEGRISTEFIEDIIKDVSMHE